MSNRVVTELRDLADWYRDDIDSDDPVADVEGPFLEDGGGGFIRVQRVSGEKFKVRVS